MARNAALSCVTSSRRQRLRRRGVRSTIVGLRSRWWLCCSLLLRHLLLPVLSAVQLVSLARESRPRLHAIRQLSRGGEEEEEGQEHRH